VIFFVGENGSGKSTLLEALARKSGVVLMGSSRRHRAHSNPYETRLADFVQLTWEGERAPASLFCAESFQELAEFLDDVALCDPGRLAHHGGSLLNTRSHGEGMLGYFAGRYQRRGLYFLDEPETALSPANQIRFLDLLLRYAGRGDTQFIIATHSPILLSCQGARILSFGADSIEEVDYEETESYQIYRWFFDERDTRPEHARYGVGLPESAR
jgi:predicted ATPase